MSEKENVTAKPECTEYSSQPSSRIKQWLAGRAMNREDKLNTKLASDPKAKRKYAERIQLESGARRLQQEIRENEARRKKS